MPCVLSFLFFLLSCSFSDFTFSQSASARAFATARSFISCHALNTYPIRRAVSITIRADDLHNANLNFEWNGSMKILLFNFYFLIEHKWSHQTPLMRLILIDIYFYYCLLQSGLCLQVKQFKMIFFDPTWHRRNWKFLQIDLSSPLTAMMASINTMKYEFITIQDS